MTTGEIPFEYAYGFMLGMHDVYDALGYLLNGQDKLQNSIPLLTPLIAGAILTKFDPSFIRDVMIVGATFLPTIKTLKNADILSESETPMTTKLGYISGSMLCGLVIGFCGHSFVELFGDGVTLEPYNSEPITLP